MAAQFRAGIVIVDDDMAILASLKFALETEGYAVRVFRSAEALLEAGLEPGDHCLVIDHGLAPGEMDGLELLAELRAGGIVLPTILTTTQPSPAVRRAAAWWRRCIRSPRGGRCDRVTARAFRLPSSSHWLSPHARRAAPRAL